MTDFSNILENIPNWKSYYTVDELHQRNADLVNEHPDKVQLIKLGESSDGETIDCLRVGDGRHNALLHGFPNPEEPFGGNLIDYLAEALVTDDELRESMDYTWYLVKCSDPDGARLNEGFHKGPFSPLNFTLNYYRSPLARTGEMTFPIRFGPLDLYNVIPETRALMGLMDRVRFSYVSSLHMMKWGGMTYEVPYPVPELYGPLLGLLKEYHVFPRKRLGTTVAPGFQQAEYFTPARGYLREWASGNEAIEPIRGCYIYEYGQVLNPDLFMLVPECCIWHDPRMWNDHLSSVTVEELVQYGKMRGAEADEFMVEVWKEAEPRLGDSRIKEMMVEHVDPILNPATNVTDPPAALDRRTMARRASEAERIGMMGRADLYRMFYLGGLVRAVDAELSVEGDERLEELRDRTYGKLLEYDQYLHDSYQVTAWPIRNLVAVSLGAVLHSAEFAKQRQRFM